MAQVCDAVLAQLSAAPDLAFVFVSPQHGPKFGPLAAEIRRRTGAQLPVGMHG